MPDRTNIHFMDGDTVAANVYLHHGGTDVPDILNEFFDEVITNIPTDTRFDDPEYLAARFVVFMARKYSLRKHPLDFLGVGVMTRDASDVQYIVTVQFYRDGIKPKITIKNVCEYND